MHVWWAGIFTYLLEAGDAAIQDGMADRKFRNAPFRKYLLKAFAVELGLFGELVRPPQVGVRFLS